MKNQTGLCHRDQQKERLLFYLFSDERKAKRVLAVGCCSMTAFITLQCAELFYIALQCSMVLYNAAHAPSVSLCG